MARKAMTKPAAARVIASEDAELEKAEQWARTAMNGPVPSSLVTLVAEYDRLRGVEAASRAVVEAWRGVADEREACCREEKAYALANELDELAERVQ